MTLIVVDVSILVQLIELKIVPLGFSYSLDVGVDHRLDVLYLFISQLKVDESMAEFSLGHDQL